MIIITPPVILVKAGIGKMRRLDFCLNGRER